LELAVSDRVLSSEFVVEEEIVQQKHANGAKWNQEYRRIREAVIQSIWSERDKTIQQRGENVMMSVNHKTQSLQKACQETTACHKAVETYREDSA
jgi:hypothetical protein